MKIIYPTNIKEKRKLLQKQVTGQGGYQTLMRKLQTKLKGNILHITPHDVDMILRYAQNYGEGGYQERLRAVLDGLKRMGVKFSYLR